jgi:hypothetical protein
MVVYPTVAIGKGNPKELLGPVAMPSATPTVTHAPPSRIDVDSAPGYQTVDPSRWFEKELLEDCGEPCFVPVVCPASVFDEDAHEGCAVDSE